MGREFRLLALVYLALMALLASTVGASQVDLGPFNPVANLGIAAAKTLLIYWFFMHLRETSGLVRLFALGVFFWLAIMLGLTVMDLVTR